MPKPRKRCMYCNKKIRTRDVVNFYDKDCERWYSVLRCERCGYPSVSWTENPMHAQDMAQGFKYSQEIGGTIDG